MASALSLEAAKAAKQAARGGSVSGSGDDYGIPFTQPSQRDTTSQTEPADPAQIDHSVRRRTPIAHPHTDVESIPKPLIECGCGGCPDGADPLAEESEVFRDVQMAADSCGEKARPMTVERAATAYYVYQSALLDRPDGKGGRLGHLKTSYAEAMAAERALRHEWDGEETTALLSFRLPPVEPVEGGVSGNDDDYGIHFTFDSRGDTDSSEQPARQWLPPLQIDTRLRDPWRNIYQALYRNLGDFEWEYYWIVSPTDSAATPHMHVYLWIQDPDDEITADHIAPAVETFVRNADSAREEHHPIDDNADSGAAVIRHDPDLLDTDSMAKGEDQIIENYEQEGEKGLQLNTAGFAYLQHQRPDWVLKRLRSGETSIPDEQTALEGAAIAWASPNDWVGSSDGFSV